MSKGIELSPRYGVNSTISVCFWCGKEKNEIALLGRIRERDSSTGKTIRGSDIAVPMRTVLNYDPCEDCQERMSKGVFVIGVLQDAPDDRPSIGKDSDGLPVYPTGSWLVARKEAFPNVEVENGSKVLMPEEVLQKILPEQNKVS